MMAVGRLTEKRIKLSAVQVVSGLRHRRRERLHRLRGFAPLAEPFDKILQRVAAPARRSVEGGDNAARVLHTGSRRAFAALVVRASGRLRHVGVRRPSVQTYAAGIRRRRYRVELFVPRARSEISFGARSGISFGGRLEGLGYAERLTMTIPPWRLPFEELRGGRFLSDGDALVWINWRGAHTLNLSFPNGVCVEDALVKDSEGAAGETRLTL